jgi:hypothetical protein
MCPNRTAAILASSPSLGSGEEANLMSWLAI